MNPSHPKSEGTKIFHKICGKSKVSTYIQTKTKFSTNLPFVISISTHHDLNQNIIDYSLHRVTKFTLCRIKTIVTENYFQESRPTRPSAAATDEKRDAAVAHVMYTYTDTYAYAFNTQSHAERGSFKNFDRGAR